MRIYKLSKIGEFHTNHNEDALVIADIGDDKLLLAVMDGCSMGKESHFASTLTAKILRKVSKEISYQTFVERDNKTIGQYLKLILHRLFVEIGQIKNQLLLETEELLSTLILGVLNKSSKSIDVIIVGDGLICSNGILYEYEQDDQPDYLGYHLFEDFESWFQNQNQKISLENINDLSMVTDGIFTFRNFNGKKYPELKEEKVISLLLVDKTGKNQENMLLKKMLELKNEFGLMPGDDLTIIRILLN